MTGYRGSILQHAARDGRDHAAERRGGGTGQFQAFAQVRILTFPNLLEDCADQTRVEQFCRKCSCMNRHKRWGFREEKGTGLCCRDLTEVASQDIKLWHGIRLDTAAGRR
jgi:hypothetical protein